MFIHDLMSKAWPLEVSPSSLYSEHEVGDIFEEPSGVYRLLKRDVVNATIVHMNWWTRIWWGGEVKHVQQDRTQVLTRNDIFKRKG